MFSFSSNDRVIWFGDALEEDMPEDQEPSTLIRPNQLPTFDPESFIGEGWSIEENEPIEHDFDLTEVQLVHTLGDGGKGSVDGETRLARLKEAGYRRLPPSVFQFLLENQHKIPRNWEKQLLISFDGAVLRSPSGHRYVLYVEWRVLRWGWSLRWLDCPFRVCTSAVL
jgi:hypothetical protein